MRINDTLTGLLLIGLAAAMIAMTQSFPAFPGQKYGPSLFPQIIGYGLIGCGAILVWSGLRDRRAGVPWVWLAPWMREPWRVGSFLLVLASLLAYILAAETVGFIPFSLATLLMLFLWLGVRPLTAVVVAVIATIGTHWFFATILRVPLPRGWLNTLL